MPDFHNYKTEYPSTGTVWDNIKARGPELYAEYCRTPIGAHSPDLQFVLQHFRKAPVKGKYVLVARVPHKEWVLGRLTGTRGNPVEINEDVIFNDLEDAERHVFRLRWQDLTGVDLKATSGGMS